MTIVMIVHHWTIIPESWSAFDYPYVTIKADTTRPHQEIFPVAVRRATKLGEEDDCDYEAVFITPSQQANIFVEGKSPVMRIALQHYNYSLACRMVKDSVYLLLGDKCLDALQWDVPNFLKRKLFIAIPKE
ncbi:hypothetical protein K9L27_02725 [Candidatus Gracilibacteria bacterium]|nr:hypothetical protein [Candidatus Gracilibacteria bacterium]